MIEKHRRARPTSNTSLGDPKCELKPRAAEIQQIYGIVLQRRMFRFHLGHRRPSVVVSHASMTTYRDPVTKRPSVMKLEGFLESDLRSELHFSDTDSHG